MAQTEYDRLWTRPEPSSDDWRARWDGARVGVVIGNALGGTATKLWRGDSATVSAGTPPTVARVVAPSPSKTPRISSACPAIPTGR